MMLPEHKQKIQQHQKDLERHGKPILDEQQTALIGQKMTAAMTEGHPIQLHVFHPYDDLLVTGTIQKWDAERGQIKIANNNGETWIEFSDILDVGES